MNDCGTYPETEKKDLRVTSPPAPGFNPHRQYRLFERYYTLIKKRSEGGVVTSP
jgi:hypothetical protein